MAVIFEVPACIFFSMAKPRRCSILRADKSRQFAGVILLVNYRPEYRHAAGQVRTIHNCGWTFRRRESAGEMLSKKRVTRSNSHRSTAADYRTHRGYPFFLEEMVQALFDEQGASAQWRSEGNAFALTVDQIFDCSGHCRRAQSHRLPSGQKELMTHIVGDWGGSPR